MFVWAHTVSLRKPLCFVSSASLIVLVFQSPFPCVCLYAAPRWLSIHLWSRGRLLNVGFCATQRIFKDKEEKTQMESRIWPIKTETELLSTENQDIDLYLTQILFLGEHFCLGRTFWGGGVTNVWGQTCVTLQALPPLPSRWCKHSKRPPKKRAKSANSLLGPKYWIEQFPNNFFSSGALLFCKVWQHNVDWNV